MPETQDHQINTADALGVGVDRQAQAAPSAAAQPPADPEQAKNAAFLGMGQPDDTEKRAREIVGGMLHGKNGGGEQKRGADGKFVSGTNTPVDQDNAPEDPDATSADASDGDTSGTEAAADDKADGEDAGDEDDRLSILKAYQLPRKNQAKALDVIASEADRILSLRDQDDDAGEDDEGETDDGEERRSPSAKTATGKGASKKGEEDDAGAADDDVERLYTAAEIREIEEQEGKLAGLEARKYNIALRDRQEREAEKAAAANREAQQGKAKKQQRSAESAIREVNNVVLPAFMRVIEDAPELKAIYGGAKEFGEITDQKHADAMGKIIAEAQELERKSKFDPSMERLTFAKALEMALIRAHKKELGAAQARKLAKNAQTVKRNGIRSLSASGGGGGGGKSGRTYADPVKEASHIVRQFMQQRA